MQKVSTKYLAEQASGRRDLVPLVVADFSDPDLVFGGVSSSQRFAYTSPDQLYNKETKLGAHRYTLEPQRFILSGVGLFYDGLPEENQGYTVDLFSDQEANFSSLPYIEVQFEKCRILQAMAIYFSDSPLDGWAVDFRLEIFSGGGLIYTRMLTDNQETALFLDGFTVYDPTAIRLTFSRWSLPQRRLRLAALILGVYEEWTAQEIYKLDVYQETSLTNTATPYGVASVSVWNKDKRFNPFAKSGIFKSIEERQRLVIRMGLRYPDGSEEQLAVGHYFMQNGGWETNAYEQTFSCDLVDIVGLVSTRPFHLPDPAPTSLEEWLAAIVAHLGENFADKYLVDAELAGLPLTGNVEGLSCGEVLRFACMATGSYFRADPETGKLYVSVLPTAGGNYLSLDLQQRTYPVNKAHEDIASITFELSSGAHHTVLGTHISSDSALNIKNPFLHTVAQAEQAARDILIHYGGTEFQVKGIGDLAAELGDIDQLETGFDTVVSARRYKQQFTYQGGIMENAPSWLYQGTGIELYENRQVLVDSGIWTVPAGVESLRVILVGGGSGGTHGQDGSFSSAGRPGSGGSGGQVLVQTIGVSPGAQLFYSVGAGGAVGGGAGGVTAFGNYSSLSGVFNEDGYSDIFGGGVYGVRGRDGRIGKQPGADGDTGTGMGGGGGAAGARGTQKTHKDGSTTTLSRPGEGQPGGMGGSGCIVLYYPK